MSQIVSLTPDQVRYMADLLDDYPDTLSIDVSELDHRSLSITVHSEDHPQHPMMGTLSAGGTGRLDTMTARFAA